ncbi:MAG: Protein often found in Actinomycetes clustered with signal peptidase and/or RNaseHII, partial [uncultured Actinomycetospora sp.]
ERGGSREVRDRHGALALPRVPRHRRAVLLRGGDRAPLLPGQLGGREGPERRRRGLLRGHHVRRLGVGHVPAGAVRQERAGGDVQGRQRRGARQARPAPRRGALQRL